MAQLDSGDEEEVIKSACAVAFEGTSRNALHPEVVNYSSRFCAQLVLIRSADILWHPLDCSRSHSPKVASTLQGVFLGVVLHPEVLRKAHAELDTVVGPHRLPDFSDKDSLPYVNAIIKEAMRWHSVVPFGVPHATVADDEFRGYFISAGTMLIPNIWYVSVTTLNVRLQTKCSTSPGSKGMYARSRSIRRPRRFPARAIHPGW